MKNSRYSDSQIISILKQAEAGTPVTDLCSEHGMSSASFDKWRTKYGSMDALLMTRMKELEAENKLAILFKLHTSPRDRRLTLRRRISVACAPSC